MPYHRILHHQPVPALRRERVPPDPALLLKTPLTEGGVEVHLRPDGSIDWLLSAPSLQGLSLFANSVERTFPGAGVHPNPVPCALPGHPADHWTFAWARQRSRHWTPLDITSEHDYADSLVTALSSPLARGHEVVVEILFRAIGAWEENMHLFTAPREKLLLYHQGLDVSMTGSYTKRIPTQWDQEQHRALSRRLSEPTYHLELRAAAYGPEAKTVLLHCVGDSYLKQFLSGRWRSLEFVKERKKVEFDQAFRSHSFTAFVNGRERRDVARSELTYAICPTWARPNAALQYYVEDQEITMLREMTSPRRGVSPDGTGPPPPVRGQQAAPGQGFPSGSEGSSPLQSAPLCVSKFLPTALPEASRQWVAMGKTFQGDITYLSENPPWHHAAVLGATGTGKSTLFLHWALEILLKRPTWSVVLIDPHGTLAEDLKALLPPDIAADTIELDPSRLAFTENGVEMVSLPLNILALPDRKEGDSVSFTSARDVIVDNLVYFVKTIWGPDVFGPQMDHNISSLASGLLEIPGTNLVDMYYILTNPQARLRFASLVNTEGIRRFVLDELPRLTNVRYSQDRVSSTLNRLGKITNNNLLRLSLCQRVNPVDFRTLLDHRLVIINLSKTKIGNEASRFLGAMAFARLWLAVLQRGVTGRHTALFVDEFQNFVTPSIAHVLTEARKFGLHLIMANQYLEQIPDEIRSAVIANTDAWVFFRMGVEDSRRAAEITRPGRRGWTEETLRALPPYRALFVQGNRLEMLTTFPPEKPSRGVAEVDAMVTASTRRYAAEETSGASPFLVGDEQCLVMLRALQEGPKTRLELAQAVPLHPNEIWDAILRCRQLGYLDFDRENKTNVLTEKGLQHLGKGGWKGGGGPNHDGLKAQIIAYLAAQGFGQAHEPAQGSNKQVPDLTHLEHGRPVNDEIETTGENRRQVVVNLEKAKGIPVYFFVPDLKAAGRVFKHLEGRTGYSVFVWIGQNSFRRASQDEIGEDDEAALSVAEDPVPSGADQSGGSVEEEGHSEPSELAILSAPPSVEVERNTSEEATTQGSTEVEGPSGLTYMRKEALGFCDRLKQLGKAVEVDHEPALWLKDLLVFYDGWDEAKLGTLMGLLGIGTKRVRLSGDRGSVCFPWSPRPVIQ
ncbi:MAG: ATP-binding protein [Nitrososphaerota archaeon]|nr:ATP-binding protein [Nitrososphaerota archaeon]